MNTAQTTKKNRKFLGILLIVLGIIGLVLPVIPGWLLIMTGLAML